MIKIKNKKILALLIRNNLKQKELSFYIEIILNN